MNSLKILMVASEAGPYARTGGLGDVMGALPAALAAQGHDVKVVIPRYSLIDGAVHRSARR
jgi:starch synthase